MHRTITIIMACLCLLGMGIPTLTRAAHAAEAKNMQTLNPKQQSVVTIAAFTAKGDMEKLTPALHKGLDAGLTVNEIKEVLVQLYAYCGFPRSLNALGTFMAVVEARRAKGAQDPAGPEAAPLPVGTTRLALGTENQTKLAGGPVTGALFDFAPAIDAFLKDHLFGDIFGRDNLDWQSREIATVAALASMDGVQPQLRAHIGISMNTGLSEAQLHSLSEGLRATVGAKEGDNAAAALQAVVQQKKK